MSNNLVVIGASGAIGIAITKRLLQLYPNANIYAFSCTKVTDCIENVVYEQIDYINVPSTFGYFKYSVTCYYRVYLL